MSIVDVVELLDVLEEVVGHCDPNEHRVPQASPAANQAKPTRPTFCEPLALSGPRYKSYPEVTSGGTK